MKKILFCTIFSFLSVMLFGQITIKDNDNNDLTNKTAFLPVSPQKIYFNITNNGASGITFRVVVTAFSIPGDAGGIAVCACGNCVPITSVPVQIGSDTYLESGATYADNQADVEYYADNSTGHALITVKVYERGNESNFAEFTLDNQYTSISQFSKNTFDMFPNPCSDVLNWNKNLTGTFSVYNVSGQKIAEYSIQSSSFCSTADLPAGIFFYRLSGKEFDYKGVFSKQ